MGSKDAEYVIKTYFFWGKKKEYSILGNIVLSAITEYDSEVPEPVVHKSLCLTKLSFIGEKMGKICAIMDFARVGQLFGHFTHSSNPRFRAV